MQIVSLGCKIWFDISSGNNLHEVSEILFSTKKQNKTKKARPATRQDSLPELALVYQILKTSTKIINIKVSKPVTLTSRSWAGVWIVLNKILDQHL